MITTNHIEGACIGIVIGFVFAVIVYILVKAFEYKPNQQLPLPGFKIPPPPPPPDKNIQHPKYKGSEAAEILKSVVEKGKLHDSIVMNALNESMCSNRFVESDSQPQSSYSFESVVKLLRDVMNNIGNDLRIMSLNQREKIRIAIPEPLLTSFKRESDLLYKTNYINDKSKPVDFRGIELIENHEFNITVFHVDWYLWGTERWVQSFKLKGVS